MSIFAKKKIKILNYFYCQEAKKRKVEFVWKTGVAAFPLVKLLKKTFLPFIKLML